MKSPYVVIVYADHGATLKDFSRSGIFNKTYTPVGNDHIFLNEKGMGMVQLTYKNQYDCLLIRNIDNQKYFFVGSCNMDNIAEKVLKQAIKQYK